MRALFIRICLICFGLFLSSASFAANELVTQFGDINACKGTGILLQEYSKISKELRRLETEGGSQDAIERHKLALEILVDGLDPNLFGYVVVVKVDGPKLVKVNVPAIEMNNQTFPLATISGLEIPPGANQFNITGSFAQVKVEFKLLGICSFADANGNLGNGEIQNAVDYVFSTKPTL